MLDVSALELMIEGRSLKLLPHLRRPAAVSVGTLIECSRPAVAQELCGVLGVRVEPLTADDANEDLMAPELSLAQRLTWDLLTADRAMERAAKRRYIPAVLID